MRKALFALLLGPAFAAAQDAPPAVEIALSNFHFAPQAIRLTAGRPVTLHLVNSAGGGHNFSAPEFFAAARDVSGPVRDGTVEVAEHGSVDVRLTPARGTYRLKCTHTLHAAFGMRGEITVE
jgi:plastocyanin